jgi:hypothetical protein
MGFSTVARAY